MNEEKNLKHTKNKEENLYSTESYYQQLADFEAERYFNQCERRRRYKLQRIKLKFKAVIEKCAETIGLSR